MRDQRGVVYLETLVAFVPVFLFFVGTLQIADAGAAHLIVKHAATVAARAAVVVLPDDGVYYNDKENAQIHQFTGMRRDDIEHAADLILGASARLDGTVGNVSLGFSAQPVVTPAGEPDKQRSRSFGERLLDTSNRGHGEQNMRERVTARVNARYTCLVTALCSRGFDMVGEASLVYQGARYIYEPRTNGLRNAAGRHHTNGNLGDPNGESANNGSDRVPLQNDGAGSSHDAVADDDSNDSNDDRSQSPDVVAATPAENDAQRASVIPRESDPRRPRSDTTRPGRGTATPRGPPSAQSIVSGRASDPARARPRNERELRGALPRNLRDIPIVGDPALRGSTVRVAYTHNDRGLITGVEVRVGEHAQARHIADHASTIQTMQRYQGLSGRVRSLLDRVQNWFSKNPAARPGSRAWETRREIEKLSGIIEARSRALEDGSLTHAERAELERERASYEEQLASHQAEVDRFTTEPGRGYVAAEDDGADPVADFFADKRDAEDNPTNPESPANRPADLGSRIEGARARAAQAATQDGDARTYAVGDNGSLNGWSPQDGVALRRDDLTALNLEYSAEMDFLHPGGRNDPRHDHGELESRRSDNKQRPLVHGGAAASHAEQLVAMADGLEGSNGPIGVSRQQCGVCRRWFREHAQQQQRTLVVADPKFTRVYYPDGQVEIYDASGALLQTVAAGTKPSATITNYIDKEW